MFTTQRKQIIREAVWKPWKPVRSKEHENVLPSLQSIKHEQLSTRQEDIQFLEYWKYENLDAAQPGVNCFAGIIHDGHVSDWLHQQGPFALRKPSPEHNVIGGIRILICEQRESDPLTFPISRDSYLRVEKHFHLSPATLPYFKNSGYSHNWRHVTTGGRNELVLITSPPANSPISGVRLSLSHDLNTSITTALLYGPHLLSAPPAGVTVSGPATSWCARPVPLIPQLRDLLDACAGSDALWTHPLLLPTALLANAVERTQAFCAHELAARVAAADEELRSCCAKRGGAGGVEATMGEVGAVADEAVGVEGLCAWESRIAAWLGDVAERTEGLLMVRGEWDGDGGCGDGGSWEVREMVEQLRTAAESGVEEARRLRAKAGWLVDMLNTSVTQTNNLLTAQLAATATRDGASVKSIALLNTLFLPAIFVATLITTFACSTHTNGTTTTTGNNNNNNNPLLSKNLRTYWATTIPLTVLLLLSWLIWRHRATRLFQADYAAIQRGEDPVIAAATTARPQQQQQQPAKTSSSLFSSSSSSSSSTPPPPPQPQPQSQPSTTSRTTAQHAAPNSAFGNHHQYHHHHRGAADAYIDVDVQDDGRVREQRGGGGVRSRVSAALLMPSASASSASRTADERPASSMSMWPRGPTGVSGVSAPEMTMMAAGRKGKGRGWEEDVGRLV
ncbi:uncharacterized protein BKCO1_3700078 [Diplodia corticola]|uniref:Uncharacterized protein n=1 Tax=Diplodia corticola TaxID=236234 RepID=A0A1J9RXU0_9PEZI|nr:uncharacterized protein BKCO1_3700078 [Diplodia corticola]OJD32636.1 hypothetical protein BKCO1_3700078 [Diplodia corticola]